jgi:hypothetical protein
MQFIGFLLCIFKDFYCANLNTRVGRIDRPSTVHSAALHERSGTTFDELRDRPSTVHYAALHERSGTGRRCFDKLSNRRCVLRVLCGKKRPFDCFALRDHLRRTQGPAWRIANYK